MWDTGHVCLHNQCLLYSLQQFLSDNVKFDHPSLHSVISHHIGLASFWSQLIIFVCTFQNPKGVTPSILRESCFSDYITSFLETADAFVSTSWIIWSWNPVKPCFWKPTCRTLICRVVSATNYFIQMFIKWICEPSIIIIFTNVQNIYFFLIHLPLENVQV